MKITDVKTWAVANPPPHFGGAPAPGGAGALPGAGGTRVVSLTNCVTPEDLADPEELLATVTSILGDVKDANVCGAP